MRILKIAISILAVFIISAISWVYLAPEQATGFFLQADRERSGLIHKQMDLPDGTHYAYLEGGKGETLLLLHGFGADKDNFTRVAKFLTPHFHVIAPDLLGFGESSHPQDADYSPIAQARRLQVFANTLGITKFHLGGSSMGGHIAMTYASLYPGDVKSLWLLDPGGVWSAPESELQTVIRETGHNPLVSRNTADFAATFRFVMFDPPFIPRPILDVMAQERIRNFDLDQRIFRQLKDDTVEMKIRDMPIPTLIVWGDHDRCLNVATAEILHKLLPKSQVIIMHNIGHLPMIEDPKQSAMDFLKFQSVNP